MENWNNSNTLIQNIIVLYYFGVSSVSYLFIWNRYHILEQKLLIKEEITEVPAGRYRER